MRKESAWMAMHRHGRVVLVRLRRAARNAEDLAAITHFLDDSSRACQQPLLLLALPALSLSPPSDEIRKLVLQNIRQRFETRVIEQAFLIVPTGNFFKRALLRSLFAGIRLTLGLHNRAFMHETIEEAVRELSARHGVSSQEVLSAARELMAADVLFPARG